jgi:hypothetical protein
MEGPAESRVRGPAQGGVEFPERLLDAAEGRLDRGPRLREGAFDFGVRLPGRPGQQRVGVGLDVLEGQSLRVHGARGGGIDEREGGPGKDHGTREAEVRVGGADLRVIGDFRGTADVGDGGQQVVLDQGTQHHARARVLGRGRDALEERFLAHHLVAAPDLDALVADSQGSALAPGHEKEVQEAGRAHGHLLVVARGQELLAYARGEPRGWRKLGHFTLDHGTHQRLQRGHSGIHDHEAGKEVLEQLRESRADRHARPVRRLQGVTHLVVPGRSRQQFAHGLCERVDGLVENDGGRGPKVRFDRGLVAEGLQLGTRVHQGGGADLRKVMVVGGHPEDRDDRGLQRLAHVARKFHGRERLVEDVEGSAKEDGLLARDHGEGFRVLQGLGVLPGLAAFGLFAGEGLRDLGPRMREGGGGRSRPRQVLAGEAEGIEVGGLAALNEVVAEERGERLFEGVEGDGPRGTIRRKHCPAVYRPSAFLLGAQGGGRIGAGRAPGGNRAGDEPREEERGKSTREGLRPCPCGPPPQSNPAPRLKVDTRRGAPIRFAVQQET